ncbi:MAG: hypothetical protein HRU01_02300 [Myxococcales bacterium]|nr:hypothetical protein [Myxococcales bacterium]
MNRKSVLATAAAALFAAGVAGEANAAHHEGGEAKIKCEGANACKGQSACATDSSGCNGQNSCKGKGWVKLTKAECEKAQAAAGGD